MLYRMLVCFPFASFLFFCFFFLNFFAYLSLLQEHPAARTLCNPLDHLPFPFSFLLSFNSLPFFPSLTLSITLLSSSSSSFHSPFLPSLHFFFFFFFFFFFVFLALTPSFSSSSYNFFPIHYARDRGAPKGRLSTLRACRPARKDPRLVVFHKTEEHLLWPLLSQKRSMSSSVEINLHRPLHYNHYPSSFLFLDYSCRRLAASVPTTATTATRSSLQTRIPCLQESCSFQGTQYRKRHSFIIPQVDPQHHE